MKLNQSGEKLDSIEKHLEENYKLLTRLKNEGANKDRIRSVESIIAAREMAKITLNGNYTETISVVVD